MEKIAIYDMSYPRAMIHIYFINILLNEIYTRHYSYKIFKQHKRRGEFVIILFLIKKGLLTSNFFSMLSQMLLQNGQSKCAFC